MTWSARLALPSFLISIFWYPLGELRRAPQRTEKHPKTNGQSQLHWITAHQRKPGKWTQRRIPSKTADLKVETECSWKTWLLIEASSTLACTELEARKEGSGKKKKKKGFPFPLSAPWTWGSSSAPSWFTTFPPNFHWPKPLRKG